MLYCKNNVYPLHEIKLYGQETHPATWSLQVHGLHSSTTLYPTDFVHASLPVNGTHISWSPLSQIYTSCCQIPLFCCKMRIHTHLIEADIPVYESSIAPRSEILMVYDHTSSIMIVLYSACAKFPWTSHTFLEHYRIMSCAFLYVKLQMIFTSKGQLKTTFLLSLEVFNGPDPHFEPISSCFYKGFVRVGLKMNRAENGAGYSPQ